MKLTISLQLVMQATMPYFLEQIEQDTAEQGNSTVALKHEISVYTTLCVEMKALVNCCDILTRFILLDQFKREWE